MRMGPTSQRSTPDSVSCQKYLGKMLRFKQFIKEQDLFEGSRGSFDTKSYIFSHYETPALILSSTALERIFGKLNKITAWHVTEQYEIGTLVRLQGKQASISALTEINPSKWHSKGPRHSKGHIPVVGMLPIHYDRQQNKNFQILSYLIFQLKNTNFLYLIKSKQNKILTSRSRKDKKY